MSLADYPAAIQLRGMPPRADPQLVLSDPVDPDQDGYSLSFRAELTAAGLIATTGVVVAQGQDLDAFFDRLVASWRGWQGESGAGAALIGSVLLLREHESSPSST